MIKAAIVGGTGYTGVELIRLITHHPKIELHQITSRSEAGIPVAELFPNLRGKIDLHYVEPDFNNLSQCDVVFFAAPNGVAMRMASELLGANVRVIDLAADFRLDDAQLWEQWYGEKHACPELLSEAVYGLPEMNRGKIKNARLVANPGCYPTAIQLGFLPLIENDIIDTGRLIADAKSGVSGAGRKADLGLSYCETNENFKAYGVFGHRHLPEIRQGLSRVTKKDVAMTFVPHLTPMIRGIHATLYGFQIKKNIDLQSLYEKRYEQEPFVDVMPSGSVLETRSVKGGNVCRIVVHQPQNEDVIVVLSVIDNLVKGAAGQAIQNCNIMFGFDETEGLVTLPQFP